MAIARTTTTKQEYYKYTRQTPAENGQNTTYCYVKFIERYTSLYFGHFHKLGGVRTIGGWIAEEIGSLWPKDGCVSTAAIYY